MFPTKYIIIIDLTNCIKVQLLNELPITARLKKLARIDPTSDPASVIFYPHLYFQPFSGPSQGQLEIVYMLKEN